MNALDLMNRASRKLGGVVKKLVPEKSVIATQSVFPETESSSESLPIVPILDRTAFVSREQIAGAFIQGTGIEIGALHNPLKVNNAAKVKYVDRISNEELRQHYPELKDLPLVELDIIDNGESLGSIKNNSQDFVIANHFLEHCENPLGAIQNMFRVLKPEGTLYLAIPDKRFTFDVERPISTIEHVRRDFLEGGDWSKEQHFDEWARYVWTHVSGESKTEEQIREAAQFWMEINYSIHFHAWTPKEMMEIILECKTLLSLNFEVELFTSGGHEIISILRKKK
jgi:SAM-dependent methyltransferase